VPPMDLTSFNAIIFPGEKMAGTGSILVPAALVRECRSIRRRFGGSAPDCERKREYQLAPSVEARAAIFCPT
jgi:hypothetical protein